MTNRLSCALAALLLFACGAKHEHVAEHPASAPAAHGHGHGHGHGHDDPEALRKLMGAMLVDMVQVRGGIANGDPTTAARHASAVAKACEHSGPPPADTKAYGERFAEFDRTLHASAAKLAGQAEAGDGDGAKKTYEAVISACVGCHGQAPLAMEVDLSALQEPL